MATTFSRRFACALLCLTATAAAQVAPPLSVRIEAPTAGVLDADLVVSLSARVSDASVRTAALTVNGITYEVPVEQGRVEQNVVAVPGNNRVSITVTRGAEVARDSETFFLRGPSAELVVLVGWASRGEIIDLWAREPSGETCKWDHRETAAGGRLLDFSQSAIGFGSQAYVLPTVTAGRYRVKLHYWAAAASDDAPQPSTLEEHLASLDTLDEQIAQASGPARAELVDERARLHERIDRWAMPAAPQTPVRCEVVLFANTPHERRWRFARTAQRAGQLDTLGEVEVTAEMIRAARRGSR